MTEIIRDASITSVPGFEAAGVACGLKNGCQPDLALIYSRTPCCGAAVFTTNRFAAAPVHYDRKILAQNADGLRAVVINSGCANACTGDRGMQNAGASAAKTAAALGVPLQSVLVMSTGVIGVQLPMEKLSGGISAAVQALSRTGGHEAALAIMTTDTRPKETAVRVNLGRHPVTIAGMAKGSGMICPNMATMLSVIATDAAIEPALLQSALHHAAAHSFNRITVDGDMSTNDTVLLMANGLAGNARLDDPGSPEYQGFVQALTQVSTALAQAMVRDGEGATKFVEVNVRGAASQHEALLAARSVADSSLVKTTLFGEDANWGRVLAAVGYSGAEVNPEGTSLWFGDQQLVEDGQPLPISHTSTSRSTLTTGPRSRANRDRRPSADSRRCCDFDLTW